MIVIVTEEGCLSIKHKAHSQCLGDYYGAISQMSDRTVILWDLHKSNCQVLSSSYIWERHAQQPSEIAVRCVEYRKPWGGLRWEESAGNIKAIVLWALWQQKPRVSVDTYIYIQLSPSQHEEGGGGKTSRAGSKDGRVVYDVRSNTVWRNKIDEMLCVK